MLLEVTDAGISVWGAGKVGVHLTPRGDAHSMGDSNPLATFSYVAQALGKRKIAFICTREALGADSISAQLKQAFGGFYIANEGFTQQTAEQVVAAGQADAVAFGQAYIANPDLAQRFKQHLPIFRPKPLPLGSGCRAVLLLDVLFQDAEWCTSHTSSKVGRRPQRT